MEHLHIFQANWLICWRKKYQICINPNCPTCDKSFMHLNKCVKRFIHLIVFTIVAFLSNSLYSTSPDLEWTFYSDHFTYSKFTFEIDFGVAFHQYFNSAIKVHHIFLDFYLADRLELNKTDVTLHFDRKQWPKTSFVEINIESQYSA